MSPTKPLILLALILAGCGTKPEATCRLSDIPGGQRAASGEAEAGSVATVGSAMYLCVDPSSAWTPLPPSKHDCEPPLDPHSGDVQIDPLYCRGGK